MYYIITVHISFICCNNLGIEPRLHEFKCCIVLLYLMIFVGRNTCRIFDTSPGARSRGLVYKTTRTDSPIKRGKSQLGSICTKVKIYGG